jgi:hypothetical protein
MSFTTRVEWISNQELLRTYQRALAEASRHSSGLVIGVSMWSDDDLRTMQDEILRRMAAPVQGSRRTRVKR